MKKLIVFVLACSFVLTGCGGDTKSKSEVTTLSKNKELTAMLSNKKNTPEFVLLGTHYQLPCKLQAFFDQGWELNDQVESNPFVKETFQLPAQSYVSVTLHKDWQAIDLRVENPTENSTLINGECNVSSMRYLNSGGTTADSLVFAGKATLKTSIDDLATLYADYEGFKNEDYGLDYFLENGTSLEVEKDSDDTSKIVNVTITYDDPDYKKPSLDRVSFLENSVIDKAKNNTLNFMYRCENNKQYSPKKYKKLIKDIESEDGAGDFIVTGKVVDKAAAVNSNDLLLTNGEEIYIFEDELNNRYAVYAQIGNSYTIETLNIGDSIKLYVDMAKILNVKEDVNYPLLTAKIIYVNDVLLADNSSEL